MSNMRIFNADILVQCRLEDCHLSDCHGIYNEVMFHSKHVYLCNDCQIMHLLLGPKLKNFLSWQLLTRYSEITCYKSSVRVLQTLLSRLGYCPPVGTPLVVAPA